MDSQEITCLILLDLWAAFNTIDHTILLNRLETNFGIKDIALKWIASFLIGRTQQVAIGDLGTDLGATSDSVTLTFGVPQGSVLGPIFVYPYKLCHFGKSVGNTIYFTTSMQMTPNYT